MVNENTEKLYNETFISFVLQRNFLSFVVKVLIYIFGLIEITNKLLHVKPDVARAHPMATIRTISDNCDTF